MQPVLRWIETTQGPQIFHGNQYNVRACLLNAQSIKGKDTLLHQYMLSAQLDLCFLTETWLKDRDSIWMQMLDLGRDGYECKFVYREKPGGGFGLIHKSTLKVSEIKSLPDTLCFEKTMWKIEQGDQQVIVTLVYRPPNCQTILKFTDEFVNFLEQNVIHQKNPIILGNFNIHINDPKDSEAMDFATTLSVMGFDQHVDFTHRQGNILDLVFTQHLAKVSVLKIVKGPFFSDHCCVLCTLGMTQSKWKR